MRHSSAFTLIELLVVVGIIAVLASLLLSTIPMIRDAAKSVSCQNNVRQLGMGLITYDGDYGRLPSPIDFAVTISSGWSRSGGWDMSILDLSDGGLLPAMRCPIHPNPPRAAKTSGYSGTSYTGTRSYAMPGSYHGGSAQVIREHTLSWAQLWNATAGSIAGARTLARSGDSSGTILLTEKEVTPANAGEFLPGTVWTQMVQSPDLATRHRRNSSAVFCDGHVQMVDRIASVGSGSIGDTYYTAKGMWTTDAGD